MFECITFLIERGVLSFLEAFGEFNFRKCMSYAGELFAHNKGARGWDMRKDTLKARQRPKS